MSGTLYVVATPIGNLEDLSPRVSRILADADLIAAEDTRHTGRLLSRLGAKTRQFAMHDHNEERATSVLIDALRDGKSVALVSDAGTPLVSDPGYRLVKAAHENGIPVSPVPGPSAVTAALSVAGLPTDRFCFEGFPKARRGARRKQLRGLAKESRTIVFFESVHRVRDSLADMAAAFGPDRRACIARELTKRHEQCVTAALGELLDRFGDDTIAGKGEFVVVVAGAAEAPAVSIDVDELLVELKGHMSVKRAVAVAARVTGVGRNDLYARMLELTASNHARDAEEDT